MIKHMENEKCDVVYCNYLVGNEATYVFTKPKNEIAFSVTITDFYYKLYIKDQTKHISLWNKLIAKNLLKEIKFDESLILGEDRSFVAELIGRVSKIFYVEERLYYYYRGNPQSVCNKYIDGLIHSVQSLKRDICFLECVRWKNNGLFKEYAEICLLQTLDNNRRIARKWEFSEQERALGKMIPETLARVKKSKYISKKIKYRALLEHYYPKTLEYEAKIKRLLGRK